MYAQENCYHGDTFREVKSLLIFALINNSALTLLIEQQEGHPACKKLNIGKLLVLVMIEA